MRPRPRAIAATVGAYPEYIVDISAGLFDWRIISQLLSRIDYILVLSFLLEKP